MLTAAPQSRLQVSVAAATLAVPMLGEGDPEWLPQRGAADLVAKPMLAMLSQQWGEIKDERKRLERWAMSLREKSISLQDQRDFDSGLESKLSSAVEENTELKIKLREAVRAAKSGQAARLSASAMREVEGAVLTSELDDAEESEQAMRHASERALESAIRAAATRVVVVAVSRAWLSWVRRWQTAYARGVRFGSLMARWRSRALAVGWRLCVMKWRRAHAEHERLYTLQLEWVQRSIVRAFGSWHRLWTDVNQALQQLRSAAMKMFKRRLSLGFSTWRAACRTSGGVSAAVRAATERERKMLGIVRRMQSRQIAIGWSAWHEQWAAVDAERERVRAILRRWLQRSLALALGSWVEAWEERTEAWKKLQHAAKRMLLRRMALGFDGWRDACAVCHAEADCTAAATERERKMGGIIRRMQSRGLSRGWSAWHEQWEAAAAEKKHFRSFMSRWLNRSLGLAFSSWAAVCEAIVDALATLRHAAMKMLKRRMALGFAGWHAAYIGERTSGAMECAARRLVSLDLARGWQSWYEVWHAHQAVDAAVHTVRTVWLRRLLAFGWGGWSVRVREIHRAIAIRRESALTKSGKQIVALEARVDAAEGDLADRDALIQRLKDENEQRVSGSRRDAVELGARVAQAQLEARDLKRQLEEERAARRQAEAERDAAREHNASIATLQAALADADALTRKAEKREKACKQGYEDEIAALKEKIARLLKNMPRGVDLKAYNRLSLRKDSPGATSPDPKSPRPQSAS